MTPGGYGPEKYEAPADFRHTTHMTWGLCPTLQNKYPLQIYNI